MSACKAWKLKRYALVVGMSGILLFSVSGPGSPLFAKDDIDVKRDSERTIYTIDSSDDYKQEEAKDKDRAWDMLKNMSIIMDKRQGNPAQNQPVQPVPGK